MRKWLHGILMRLVWSSAAKLAGGFKQETIGAMRPGDRGYAVHWAMSVDEDGRCGLNPRHTIWENPGGTASMLVIREIDGFHVYPREKYTEGSHRPGSIPVTAVHTTLHN